VRIIAQRRSRIECARRASAGDNFGSRKDEQRSKNMLVRSLLRVE
jgi:hypothetical protein